MKKILVLLILTFKITIFASFLDENFKAYITEYNNNIKKEYILEYKDDKYKIEILSPSINKGEIYTYEKDNKYIYYPKLKQTVKQSFTNEDTDIIRILKDMKNIKKTSIKNKKKYIVENSNIVKIETENYNIKIDYNKNNMPNKVTVYNSNENVEFIWKY